jgi:Cu/Ag efflux protein CusF
MALSVAAVVTAFAAPARAADEDAAKAEKPKKHQFTGVIESASGDTVVVKKDKESKSFKVGEKTKCRTADKEEATLADLKAGEKVTVNYTEEDGALIAHKIGPPASMKKKETDK